MSKIIHNEVVYSDTEQFKYPFLINGVGSNGVTDVFNYGECSTAAATAAKVVSCSGFTLVNGSEINVRFVYSNTADPANLTLNVNNTGAKAIKFHNAALTSASLLVTGGIYHFVYDGTAWQLTGGAVSSTGAAIVAITSAGYEALSAAEKNSNTLYIITDPPATIGDLEYDVISTW